MRASQVLDALRQRGNVWTTRTELAKMLGRNRLNQLDFEALVALEAKGDIEVDRRPDPRPVGFVAYYKVKTGTA